MVIYNVTVSIDQHIAEAWLNWMREKHIPDVMNTGHFKECRICRVHGEEEGGITYAVIYLAHSQEELETYQRVHSPRLQAEHNEKFGGKFAAFRTLLSVLDEYRAT